MSDFQESVQTEAVEPEVSVTETTEKKRTRKPKAVNVKNESKRPITLIASKNSKKTFLPTETVEVSGDFMSAVRKNKAAMTFFESGDLVEV